MLAFGAKKKMYGIKIFIAVCTLCALLPRPTVAQKGMMMESDDKQEQGNECFVSSVTECKSCAIPCKQEKSAKYEEEVLRLLMLRVEGGDISVTSNSKKSRADVEGDTLTSPQVNISCGEQAYGLVDIGDEILLRVKGLEYIECKLTDGNNDMVYQEVKLRVDCRYALQRGDKLGALAIAGYIMDDWQTDHDFCEPCNECLSTTTAETVATDMVSSTAPAETTDTSDMVSTTEEIAPTTSSKAGKAAKTEGVSSATKSSSKKGKKKSKRAKDMKKEKKSKLQVEVDATFLRSDPGES